MDIKFEKPVKNYEQAGYDDNLFKKDVYEKDSEGFTRFDMMVENRKQFDRNEKESLKWELKGIAIITADDFVANEGFAAVRYRKTIKHDLGYNPIVIAGVRLADTENYIPCPYNQFFFSGGYGGFLAVNISVTKSTASFDLYVETYTPTFPYTIKYYILRERINEEE